MCVFLNIKLAESKFNYVVMNPGSEIGVTLKELRTMHDCK